MSKLSLRNILIFFLLFFIALFLWFTMSSGTEKMENQPETIPEKSLPVSRDSFGTVTVTADAFLDGQAENVDSPEFFENGENTLLLVSGKKNDVIEIWPYPFIEEASPLKRDSLPNGLAVDQDLDLLLIGDSDKELLEIFSLPDLQSKKTLGQGTLKSGETNLDVLSLPNGKKYVYGTDDDEVHGFDLDTGALTYTITPEVESIEEVLVDSFYQVIYVPEENGGESEEHKGGAITAYTPEGEPFVRNDTSVFGQGVFSQDGEGITMYRCPNENGSDSGSGFIIASDQRNKLNDFEFFDRLTWQHLGTLRIEEVSFTDGIVVSNKSLPLYPKGIFAAVNSDQNTALVSWEKIEKATGLSCP